jgi:hypothetical protein
MRHPCFEHRDGGVRRILTETVVALRPFLDQMRREGMTCGTHRPIGKYDRVWCYAGQRQCLPVAPREFITIRAGSIFGFSVVTVPIFFIWGAAGMLC